MEEHKKQLCQTGAAHLRIMRAYLDWSQSKLASCVGTTRKHISEIENGRAALSWTLFLALAVVFALNPETREFSVFRQMADPQALLVLSNGRHERDELFQGLENSEKAVASKRNGAGEDKS